MIPKQGQWQEILKEAIDQTIMVLGVLLGIISSEAVLLKVKGGATASISFPFSTGEMVIYLIIAIFIMPFVYDKLKLDPNLPFIVKFGLYVQSGVSYPVIFNAFSVN